MWKSSIKDDIFKIILNAESGCEAGTYRKYWKSKFLVFRPG